MGTEHSRAAGQGRLLEGTGPSESTEQMQSQIIPMSPADDQRPSLGKGCVSRPLALPSRT